jgi:hypothetical protein
MYKLRLTGVKQEGRLGTTYKAYRVDDAGNVVADEKAPSYFDFNEVAAPDAPGANIGRLFVRDNGSGKTQLCVRFPTGAIQVVSTEP